MLAIHRTEGSKTWNTATHQPAERRAAELLLPPPPGTDNETGRKGQASKQATHPVAFVLACMHAWHAMYPRIFFLMRVWQVGSGEFRVVMGWDVRLIC